MPEGHDKFQDALPDATREQVLAATVLSLGRKVELLRGVATEAIEHISRWEFSRIPGLPIVVYQDIAGARSVLLTGLRVTK